MKSVSNNISFISVIVPAYNESASLEELYLRVRKSLSDLNLPFEFWIIDDGSTDETYETAKCLQERFSNIGIIHFGKNQGKSIALSHGFQAATGDVSITLDADLQDEPEMIPSLLEKLAEGYDLVCGNRINRKDKWFKKILSKAYNLFVRLLYPVRLNDINCGLKALRKEVYKKLILREGDHRLLPLIAYKVGYRVTEVPIRHAPRKFGKSKYKLFRFKGLIDLLALAYTKPNQRFSFMDYYKIGILSLSVAAASLTLWGVLLFTFSILSTEKLVFSIILIPTIVASSVVGISSSILGKKAKNKEHLTKTQKYHFKPIDIIIYPSISEDRLDKSVVERPLEETSYKV